MEKETKKRGKVYNFNALEKIVIKNILKHVQTQKLENNMKSQQK
jgi:hypothetical protein